MQIYLRAELTKAESNAFWLVKTSQVTCNIQSPLFLRVEYNILSFFIPSTLAPETCSKIYPFNIKVNWRGRGGWPMVSILTYYSNNPSAYPSEVYSFPAKMLFEINKNMPSLAHLKKQSEILENENSD